MQYIKLHGNISNYRVLIAQGAKESQQLNILLKRSRFTGPLRRKTMPECLKYFQFHCAR